MKRFDIGDLFLAQPAPDMGAGGGQPAMSTGGAPSQGSGSGMGTEGMTAQPPKEKEKTQSSGGCLGGGGWGMVLPLVLMFVVFYFFLIRPQQKKQKEHQEMLGALRKGDQVITTGGILGKITGLTDQYAVIEVQEKVRMKILRSHIAGKQTSGGSGDKDKQVSK